MGDEEPNNDFENLSREIRELRASIVELNGLLKTVFRVAAEAPTPKAARPKKKPARAKQPQEPKPKQSDSTQPIEKPGRHF